MEIGESFVGAGGDAAHVNTVVGDRDGPVGAAWATALATPTSGFARFVVVAEPGVPVQPMTVFVNKAEIADENHARLTWGPAQAGVAGGVMDAVDAGSIDATALDALVVIAAVWVDPAATDADAVYRNNRAATAGALAAGHARRPSLDEVRAAVAAGPTNPFYVTRPGTGS